VFIPIGTGNADCSRLSELIRRPDRRASDTTTSTRECSPRAGLVSMEKELQVMPCTLFAKCLLHTLDPARALRASSPDLLAKDLAPPMTVLASMTASSQARRYYHRQPQNLATDVLGHLGFAWSSLKSGTAAPNTVRSFGLSSTASSCTS
jgi:hypothetical protein